MSHSAFEEYLADDFIYYKNEETFGLIPFLFIDSVGQ